MKQRQALCVPSSPPRCAASSSTGKTGARASSASPTTYRLPEPLGRRRKPKSLTFLDLDAEAEVYLERRQIRSAFAIDIAADQRVIAR